MRTQAAKILWCYSHDGYGEIVYNNLFAQDFWIEIEIIFPIRPAEDCGKGRMVLEIVFRPQQTAQGGMESESGEKASVNIGTGSALRLRTLATHGEILRSLSDQGSEDMILAAQELKRFHREAVEMRFAREAMKKFDKICRIAHWQCLQQQGIH